MTPWYWWNLAHSKLCCATTNKHQSSENETCQLHLGETEEEEEEEEEEEVEEEEEENKQTEEDEEEENEEEKEEE